MTPLSKELLLPQRQALFVEAYCMGQNATKAAMAAGYSILLGITKASDQLMWHHRARTKTVKYILQSATQLYPDDGREL